MSPQKWGEIYFIELQILHNYILRDIRVSKGQNQGGGGGVVKLRNATARELLNSIIHYHFGQTLNGVSLKEIGRPPSFTSAWFSQTMTLKSSNDSFQVKFSSLYWAVQVRWKSRSQGNNLKSVKLIPSLISCYTSKLPLFLSYKV